ncbi:MAG: hypothetical protein RL153_1429 [Verrucomicrobiota bacterium]
MTSASMVRWVRVLLLGAASLVIAARAFPQGRAPGAIGGGELVVPEHVTSPREVETRTGDMAFWTNPPAFKKELFTFARVRYDKNFYAQRNRRTGGWTTDLPDSDINLSYRLQQMTSIRVEADGRIIRLTDPALAGYPFLFLSAPGALDVTEDEARALRQHLLNGGFLLMDDFWGEAEWEQCAEAMAKVFPERKFAELPLTHPLYHGVFEIKAKHQNANVRMGTDSQFTGVTWERPDAQEVHHRAITDDSGRVMVLALHNTDTADGWERENDNDYYFHNFSEKVAFPLGVNIIHYVMTH